MATFAFRALRLLLSVFINLVKLGDYAASASTWSTTGTKERKIYFYSGQSGTYANATDNAGAFVSTAYTVGAFKQPCVIGFKYQHLSPYITSYVNGLKLSTYTGGDFTSPSWASTFSFGGTSEHLGVLRGIAIYSRLTDERARVASEVMADNLPQFLGLGDSITTGRAGNDFIYLNSKYVLKRYP